MQSHYTPDDRLMQGPDDNDQPERSQHHVVCPHCGAEWYGDEYSWHSEDALGLWSERKRPVSDITGRCAKCGTVLDEVEFEDLEAATEACAFGIYSWSRENDPMTKDETESLIYFLEDDLEGNTNVWREVIDLLKEKHPDNYRDFIMKNAEVYEEQVRRRLWQENNY